jgi:hypothetical protein
LSDALGLESPAWAWRKMGEARSVPSANDVYAELPRANRHDCDGDSKLAGQARSTTDTHTNTNTSNTIPQACCLASDSEMTTTTSARCFRSIGTTQSCRYPRNVLQPLIII